MAKNSSLEIREKTIFDGIFFKYILKFFFKLFFKLAGWSPGPAPKVTGVVIGAPHTSNWDFIFGIGAAIIEDAKIYFSIKESWCQLPVLGALIMWLGAIPIDRSVQGKGQVEKIKKFAQRQNDRFVYFAFTPEGTRSKVEKWKTGFYHMALDCQFPIHLAQVDYINKKAGIFHTFIPSGDKEQDLAIIQYAYRLIHGKNTENQYPPYIGAVPQISQTDASLMKALYLINDQATHTQIAASASFSVHEQDMLEPLCNKGYLEKSQDEYNQTAYALTLHGKGVLLHLFSEL